MQGRLMNLRPTDHHKNLSGLPVIRNVGQGPLKLAKGPTNCKCTVAGLKDQEIPPGGQASIRLEFTPNDLGPFRQGATIWTNDPEAIPAEIRAAYLDASRDAVVSIVADYRASAGVDVEHDKSDRAAGKRLAMPVAVLQQDWGAAMGFDAAALWRAWAPDLHHSTVASGHFMAEEAPADVVKTLRTLLAR
jgi:hypothetical protein